MVLLNAKYKKTVHLYSCLFWYNLLIDTYMHFAYMSSVKIKRQKIRPCGQTVVYCV